MLLRSRLNLGTDASDSGGSASQSYGLVNEQAPESSQWDCNGECVDTGGGDDNDDDDCEGSGFDFANYEGTEDLDLVDAPTRVGKIDVKYETVAKKVTSVGLLCPGCHIHKFACFILTRLMLSC